MHIFNLPISKDIDGRVVKEIFRDSSEIKKREINFVDESEYKNRESLDFSKKDDKLIKSSYQRHKGRALEVLISILEPLLEKYPEQTIHAAAITGTGGMRIARALNVPFFNEVIAEAKAVHAFYTSARVTRGVRTSPSSRGASGGDTRGCSNATARPTRHPRPWGSSRSPISTSDR